MSNRSEAALRIWNETCQMPVGMENGEICTRLTQFGAYVERMTVEFNQRSLVWASGVDECIEGVHSMLSQFLQAVYDQKEPESTIFVSLFTEKTALAKYLISKGIMAPDGKIGQEDLAAAMAPFLTALTIQEDIDDLS